MNRRTAPLVLLSCLALALFVARVLYTGEFLFLFLSWNLFLAWIPYGLSRLRWRRTWGVVLMLAWLAFFPNAPYLVTDFVHLRARRGVPHWFDIAMLSTFAFAGVWLAIRSLEDAHAQIEERFGATQGWLFAFATTALSGLGIYIGRFLRWNSWDLVIKPYSLAHDMFAHFVHPPSLARAVGVTMVFSALLFCSYLVARFDRATP